MEQLITGIQNDLTEREEEKKLLDEARANKALDGGGGNPVQGQRPTMGTEKSQNEAPRGRVDRKTNDNNKKQGTINNSAHVKYAYHSLKCMYTNADSLMNKFIEFKERVKMSNCLVTGITEVKPKNHLNIYNQSSRTRT